MSVISSTKLRVLDLDLACLSAGEGPLVLLCHGFPELSYSWRHQLLALADAGYRAVAPDLRGYGKTLGPSAADQCSFDHLIEDLVAIVAALGEDSAALVGHDFGAFLGWHAAAMRPEIFTRVACFAVPYPTFLMGPSPPTKAIKKRVGADSHYILYFQEEGVAERELDANVRETLLRIYWSSCGQETSTEPFGASMPAGSGFLENTVLPDRLPDWLDEADLGVYVEAFSQRGFAGPLAWYRAVDRSWEGLAAARSLKVEQPALFVMGRQDPIFDSTAGLRRRMKEFVPGLVADLTFEGCGHWVQQERPLETSRALVEFLDGHA